MKNVNLITLLATALMPVAAFSQPQPAPPAPPSPPTPAVPPIPGHERNHEPKVPVTYLGVETSEIPSVLCDQLGLAKGFGLVVDYVVPNGPAASAGVQQNDIIKMLNDQILTDPGQLGKLIRSYQDGTTVTLTVLRKGQEQKMQVKLAKKEVPRRNAMMDMGHGFQFNFGDMGNLGNLDELKDQLNEMKDQQREQVRQAVTQAREAVKEAAERARESAQQRVRTYTRMKDGGVQQTTIDLKNAQIVVTDDKGEIRIENKDGKKFLTAKDAQGKMLFTGPIDSKEDVDKVPADVRKRYESIEQRDIPAIDLRADKDNDNDEDMDDDNDDETANSASCKAGAVQLETL